jgi:type IV pilus assembly protein PilA
LALKQRQQISSIQFVPLRKQHLIMRVAKEKSLQSYVGGVFLVPAKNFEPNAAKEEITTTSILCEADSPGTIKPAEPTYENGKIACGKGTTQWTR